MVPESEKPDARMAFHFSGHAVQRMFARQIPATAVIDTINNGEIIARYPEDIPFPSFLVLGKAGALPLHAVYALDRSGKSCHVITAYIPDQAVWENDFRTRRKK